MNSEGVHSLSKTPPSTFESRGLYCSQTLKGILRGYITLYFARIPMISHLTHLSSISDAGQFVWGSRNGCQCHPMLPFSLAFFSQPWPHSIVLSSHTMRPINRHLGRAKFNHKPSFYTTHPTFDAQPAIMQIPDSTYDNTANTGNYTLEPLPLKSGTKFVVYTDDGYSAFFSCPVLFRALTPPPGLFSPSSQHHKGPGVTR